MAAPGSWRGVVQKYKHSPTDVQKYFSHVPALAASFPWDVCLAYQFSRVETAHKMALYCGVVKKHRANPTLAWLAVQNEHLTKDHFGHLFASVFGQALDKTVTDVLEGAQKTRNRIMHGKSISEAAKREAVVDVLRYARVFNDYVDQLSGLRPFGDLRGFKGRAVALDRGVSRLILKGLGFALS